MLALRYNLSLYIGSLYRTLRVVKVRPSNIPGRTEAMYLPHGPCACVNHLRVPGRRSLQCPEVMPESPYEMESRVKNDLNLY